MSAPTSAANSRAARVYLVRQQEDMAVVNLPDTQYQLHLKTAAPLRANAQNRVYGLIRCPVWKLDRVSSGGSYIEPVMGRPRRLQGKVVGPCPDEPGSLILEVCRMPVIARLPERWNPADFRAGEAVGIEVHEGSSIEQV